MGVTPGNDEERDAGLAALYRASAQDEPPPALDDAIRAAARRGVSSKPRLAGSPFSRSWRVPMSIAAVLVLCVSLVMLMREEESEVAGLPRAEVPATDVVSPPARRAADAGTNNTGAAAQSEAVPAAKTPLRAGPEPSPEKPPARAEADASGAAPAVSARSVPTQAFPGSAARDRALAVPPAENTQRLAKEEMQRDVAAATAAQQQALPAKAARLAGVAEGAPATTAAPAPTAGGAAEAKSDSKVQAARADSASRESEQRPPAPAVKTRSVEADIDLPPEKWLERIEELRKQGKLTEAKASLTEFRKRFPDHALPPSLKSWAMP